MAFYSPSFILGSQAAFVENAWPRDSLLAGWDLRMGALDAPPPGSPDVGRTRPRCKVTYRLLGGTSAPQSALSGSVRVSRRGDRVGLGESNLLPVAIAVQHPRQDGRQLEHQLQRLCRKAGLPAAVTPHSRRHSYATENLALGAALRNEQDALGHSDPWDHTAIRPKP